MAQTPDLTGMPAEYRRHWREFTIWCAVTDTDPLPAHTDTVLDHLADQHGAALGSQRARVAALNAVHRAAGLPEPGRAEPIRRLLNPDRGPARQRAADRVHDLLPGLPVTGWPAGLFGRRDAVLLTLAAAGLPFTRLAALRQGEVHITDDAVTIGTQPQLVLSATGDPHRCPVLILRRWAAVLVHAPHAGAPALLEYHLGRDEPPSTADQHADHRNLPLLTGFDHRGTPLALPGKLATVTATHLAALAAAHHNGRAPTRRRPRPVARPTPLPQPVLEPDIQLDPDYYERGIAARHRAHALAADLDELFDRLDRETDQLLALSHRDLETP